MRVISVARSISTLLPASHGGVPILIVGPQMLGLREQYGISWYKISDMKTSKV